MRGNPAKVCAVIGLFAVLLWAVAGCEASKSGPDKPGAAEKAVDRKSAVEAGQVRLLERRIEIRQKTEAEWDLPPNCVMTGIGARAHYDNLTTLWIQYRPILADGSLGEAKEKHLGSEPDHACEGQIFLPEGWVMVGFGARGAPEWDVATLRVWGRQWGPDGPTGEVKVWSGARDPEAGCEREIQIKDDDRVLVGGGLRFHVNDIAGIYARSARAVRVPEGDRSMKDVSKSSREARGPDVELLPTVLGPVPVAAIDPGRIQSQLLKAWQDGRRGIIISNGKLHGTSGELAMDICAALMKDPFADADEILRDAVERRVGADAVETAVRALRRVPQIARQAYLAVGKPMLGKNGIPLPDEMPDIDSNEKTIKVLEGEKEAARWLLVQSRGEVKKLLEERENEWLKKVAKDLEDLQKATDVWQHLARAVILSRMYLVDGSEASRTEAREAIGIAKKVSEGCPFGDAGPLVESIEKRLQTPPEKTELGAKFAEIFALIKAGDGDKAAANLKAIIEGDEYKPHLRRHWPTIWDVASASDVFGHDTKTTRILWGGDGGFEFVKKAGRWSFASLDGHPCIYVDFKAEPKNASLHFEYFDDQEAKIFVHYNALDEKGERVDYCEAEPVVMKNTGEWRSAAVELPNCGFGGHQNMGADLRIIPGKPGVAVREIRIQEK